MNKNFLYVWVFSVPSSSEYLKYLPSSNRTILVRTERTTLYIGLGSKIKLSSCFHLFTERGTRDSMIVCHQVFICCMWNEPSYFQLGFVHRRRVSVCRYGIHPAGRRKHNNHFVRTKLTIKFLILGSHFSRSFSSLHRPRKADMHSAWGTRWNFLPPLEYDPEVKHKSRLQRLTEGYFRFAAICQKLQMGFW